MKRLRRASVLFAASGALLLALAAGDVLAGAKFGGGGWAEVLHGSSEGETTSGMEGDDLISDVRGPDEVYGGPGREVLLGGPGDDFIEAKDGVEDFVVCGAGHDVASVDKEDFVSRDCEIVYRA